MIFKSKGIVTSLYFHYRDETDIVYHSNTLIRNEDDVIKVMTQFFKPDNDTMVIKETLLDVIAFKEEIDTITTQLRKYLDD